MTDYDVIIIGSGPAGISASLYSIRAGLRTVVITAGDGALKKAERIENYYGLYKPMSGSEIHEIGERQAEDLGVKIYREQVVAVDYNGFFSVTTQNNDYTSDTVILATGASRKTPNIKGLSEYEGRGVSYCAVCDAFFYRKKNVAVIGEGQYAYKEATELANVTDNVHILTNGKMPETDMGSFPVMTERIIEIKGDEKVQSVVFESGLEKEVSGVFIAVGIAGSTEMARKIGAVIQNGKIAVNEKMETSVPGLYAAGDCIGAPYQIYKAVYDGATAGRSALSFLKKQE